MNIKLYSIDGDFIEQRMFTGSPMLGDRIMVGDELGKVVRRRWTDDGELELILNFEV